MISTSEATSIVLANSILQDTEEILLENAVGRVLATPVLAQRPVPPFDRVAMDGIAINYAAFEAGQRTFKVEGIFGAGDPEGHLADANACVEIMTGACMAKGADTVIRYEDVSIKDGLATVTVDEIRARQNIHRKGQDEKKGAVLIPKNHLISPTDICVLASEGKAKVLVYKVPKIGIISSGDELVEVTENPLPHQIRRSNVYAIRAMMESYKLPVKMYHLLDDKAEIEQGLSRAFAENDTLIMVGGVSKGKYDFIPDVLQEMGAIKLFHRVAQRPGKPFWFGELGTQKIFALPGNPVSSMMCTIRYFMPWLRKSLHLQPDNSFPVELAEQVNFKPALTRLLEVELVVNERGVLQAFPKIGNGSGDFLKLVHASAFIELPAAQQQFKPGEILRAWRFRGER